MSNSTEIGSSIVGCSLGVVLPQGHIQSCKTSKDARLPFSVQGSANLILRAWLLHLTWNHSYLWFIWQPYVGPFELEYVSLGVGIPDRGCILQLGANKCIIGSLSDFVWSSRTKFD